MSDAMEIGTEESTGVAAPVQTAATRLNVGSGEDYRDGTEWCNLDIDPRYDPDVRHDIERPWPFEPDSFEVVVAQHVFEHCSDLDFQMRQAARVLEPGGRLVWTYPIGREARTDPTHEQYLTPDSCLWFARNHGEWGGDAYQISSRHPLALEDRDVRRWLHLPDSWRRPIPGHGGEVTATYVRLGGGV